MRIDRHEFLTMTAVIAAHTSCTPQSTARPEPGRVPEDSGTVAVPTASIEPIASPPDAGATSPPVAAEPPPQSCDDATPITVAACDMKNPCAEGNDVGAECRLWVKALLPRSAAKVVACLKRSTDPQVVCDYREREKCAQEGFAAACPDARRHRATCERIAAGCKKGRRRPHGHDVVDVDRCIATMSATSPAGRKPMIACFEEYCGATDGRCLEFRMRTPHVRR